RRERCPARQAAGAGRFRLSRSMGALPLKISRTARGDSRPRGSHRKLRRASSPREGGYMADRIEGRGDYDEQERYNRRPWRGREREGGMQRDMDRDEWTGGPGRQGGRSRGERDRSWGDQSGMGGGYGGHQSG